MKVRLLTALGLIAFLFACAKKNEAPEKHDEHAHAAPHGGTLVELGEHVFNLELLRDRKAGRLTAWVLDAHAEKFVRIAAPTIELVAMPGGKYTPLPLKAVANATTGEKVGDTSQFEAQADWLRDADEFAGILTVEIQGRKFEQVAYVLPK